MENNDLIKFFEKLVDDENEIILLKLISEKIEDEQVLERLLSEAFQK